MTSSIRASFLFLLNLLAIAAPDAAAQAETAPDATAWGPLQVVAEEYRFPASLDPDVLAIRKTEIWARIYRPEPLFDDAPHPLILFLHGNHATCGTGSNPRIDDNCQYTTRGTCPPGYSIVPNHSGYGYLARPLASWGYVVVSINANRGINCGEGPDEDIGLNLARGRLLLKHLQILSEWNQGAPTPPSVGVTHATSGWPRKIPPEPQPPRAFLAGKLDFDQIGMLGHSRGGEGVRAAYHLYREPESPWPLRIPDPLNFRAIFEVAAVDGQTPLVLDAEGIVWNQVLPMCDGDVWNLQGVKPFDRMMDAFEELPPSQKSTFTIWGANHNFFNTEWQENDSFGCYGHDPIFPDVGGSPDQRQVALQSVMAFFRGNLGTGPDSAYNRNFDPRYAPPPVVSDITRVDLGFSPTSNDGQILVLEDFTAAQANTYDLSGVSLRAEQVPRHDSSLTAGLVRWAASGPGVYLQINGAPPGSGADLSGYNVLNFRASRMQDDLFNPPGTSTDFKISFIDANGFESLSVSLGSYADLTGPVGSLGSGPPRVHPILQTVRIPLEDFEPFDFTSTRGLRFTFESTLTGAVYLANIRLSIEGAGLGALRAAASLPAAFRGADRTGEPLAGERTIEGRVISIREVDQAAAIGGEAGVEIEVAGSVRFPVRDNLPTLYIGKSSFAVSRYPESGATDSLIFTVSKSDYDRLPKGLEVSLQYGKGSGAPERWELGRLSK